MVAPPRKLFAPEKLPWAFLALAVIVLVIQLNGPWRSALVFDRTAIEGGEWWRIWTGHLVHFGWPHFVADAALFLILGWLLERENPIATRSALLVMPAFISWAIYTFDPTMLQFGGLSALNLGLLVFLAGKGWQKNWTDWFWPAVLAIYVGEIVLESALGRGRGGGMIKFDDPTVQVATLAHVAGAIYGGSLAMILFLRDRRAPPRAA